MKGIFLFINDIFEGIVLTCLFAIYITEYLWKCLHKEKQEDQKDIRRKQLMEEKKEAFRQLLPSNFQFPAPSI